MNRKLITRGIISVIAISMSLFHIYYSTFGFLTTLKLRSFHLMFAMVLIFLTYPSYKNNGQEKEYFSSKFDCLLAILSVIVGLYIIFEEKELGFRMGQANTWDIIVGVILVILTLEITRRAVGLPLVITAVVFLTYAFFGNYLPSFFAHRGYSLGRVISHLCLFTDGIYGIPIGVCARFILMFILFGAVLEKTGGGDFFMRLANAIAGKGKGGPAKVAVVASGFMGSISGSAVANVVATGTFTIPMMKKVGYKPSIAGAIEAAASSGGYIMPPVMGAAAFIISEFTGYAYINIAKISFIPAIIYYSSIYAFVHFNACKEGIHGLNSENIPPLKKTLKEGGYFLVGIFVLLFMLIKQYSPAFSVIIACSLILLLSFIRQAVKKMTFKDVIEALELGARNTLMVSAACACAGIIIGIITLTGVGLAFSSSVLVFTYGKLILGIILTMLAGVFLSMSLVVVADYIVLAILFAPALVNLGLDLLTAHLICLWCASFSNVTPPVALASYAAAGIAKSNPMKTALYGVRIAKGFYIMPFLFAYTSLLSENIWTTIYTGFMISIGLICLEAALSGHFLKRLNSFEKFCLLAVSILTIYPKRISNFFGITLLIYIFIKQRYLTRNS